MQTSSPQQAVLEVLAGKVRAITLRQAAAAWFAENRRPQADALACLRRMEKQNLVGLTTITTHPELSLDRPLFSWRPSQAELPHFARLAWLAKNRWSSPPVRTVVATATNKAKALFGGATAARPMRPMERDHDLAVAAVYLHLLQTDPARAASWLHEDELPSTAGVPLSDRPDAVLVDADGEECVLELLGRAYGPKKIERVFERHRRGRLELW